MRAIDGLILGGRLLTRFVHSSKEPSSSAHNGLCSRPKETLSSRRINCSCTRPQHTSRSVISMPPTFLILSVFPVSSSEPRLFRRKQQSSTSGARTVTMPKIFQLMADSPASRYPEPVVVNNNLGTNQETDVRWILMWLHTRSVNSSTNRFLNSKKLPTKSLSENSPGMCSSLRIATWPTGLCQDLVAQ